LPVLKRLKVDAGRLAERCASWRVADLWVFGSALRDGFRDDSDVDLLVTFLPDSDPSFGDLFDMQEQFGALFGRSVDLVERKGVEESPNYIRRRNILGDLERVYGGTEQGRSHPSPTSPRRPRTGSQVGPQMDRDDAYLLDMLITARDACRLFEGMSYDDLQSNQMAQHALAHLLDHIGAAAGKVSEGGRLRHLAVPWADIVSLHDRFGPEHFHIDLAKAHHVVRSDLPNLIRLLEAIVPPDEDSRSAQRNGTRRCL